MDQSDQTWETSTFCQCHNAIEVQKKMFCKRHIYFILVNLKRKVVVDNRWCNKCAAISVQLSGPKKVALTDSLSKFLPNSRGFLNTAAWNALLRALRIDLESHDISKICLQLLRFKSWCTNLWSNSLGLIDNTWRLWDSCNNRQCQFYAKF